MRKIALGKNVLAAAHERINWVFHTFDKVCLSFSGGKDSTAMLHLAADTARQQNRKFCVMFVDWEIQFSQTIAHVLQMKALYADVIDKFYWIALPLTTVNSLSPFKPLWVCWDKGARWARVPPADAITDEKYFPFYYSGMLFEEFIQAFGKWFARDKASAILVGIRTEESLNRHRTIFSKKKMMYADDKPWTTASAPGFNYYIYPIYDWKIKDVWLYFSREKKPVNPIYELMYKANISPHNMRICAPCSMEQRKNLWLYSVLDPATWNRASERLPGACSGALYGKLYSEFYGQKNLARPDGFSWQSYALFLLETLPPGTSDHYKNKVFLYLTWHQSKAFPDNIPEMQENDLGSKDVPSWRRICKCILKNDYWCRMLSFSPTKMSSYGKYCQRIKLRRKNWTVM